MVFFDLTAASDDRPRSRSPKPRLRRQVSTKFAFFELFLEIFRARQDGAGARHGATGTASRRLALDVGIVYVFRGLGGPLWYIPCVILIADRLH